MKYIRLKNLKVRTKLLLLGAVSIIGVLVLGIQATVATSRIKQINTDISQYWLPSVVILEDLNTKTSDYRIQEYSFVMSDSKEEREELEEELNVLRNEIWAGIDEYKIHAADKPTKAMIEKAEAIWKDYMKSSETMLAVSRANSRDPQIKQLFKDTHDTFKEGSDLFLEIVEYNEKEAARAGIQDEHSYMQYMIWKIALLILITLIIAGLDIHLIRTLEKPIVDVTDGVWRIANGDLRVHIDYNSNDEIGTLAKGLNDLVWRLNTIIEDEKQMFDGIGDKEFKVKTDTPQVYRGDFATILYDITGLASRMEREIQKSHEDEKKDEKKDKRKADDEKHQKA